MTNVQTTTQEFNAFNYVKGCILKAYAKALLEGKDVKEFVFETKNYHRNQGVIAYLNKVGALKVAKVESSFEADETGKVSNSYLITIKDFNVDCKATSKAGKEFRVFNMAQIGSAMMRARA